MIVRRILVILGAAVLTLTMVRVTTAQNGDQKASGLGLCAKCALHMTPQCQNALVIDAGGRRQVYLLKDNQVSKAFHKDVCKTSVPIVVVGRVVRASGPRADGVVVLGEIEPSSLALDDCEINPVVTLGGVGQCAKCSLKQSTTCVNVMTCHLDAKDVTFWLADNEVSKAFHKTICKSREVILATGKQEGKDAAGHEIFTPIKLERVVSEPASVQPSAVEHATKPVEAPVAAETPLQKLQYVMGNVWCEPASSTADVIVRSSCSLAMKGSGCITG